MARSEARIQVTIWSDPDFRALAPGAQWTFMFLLSQPDLAHDGVIALRTRRWSQSAAGLTPSQLLTDLKQLHEARFVVIDVDAEELLVRSFIRRDRVYRQPNVLRAAADHLPVVTSESIRYELADELARIAEEEMPSGSRAIVAEMRAGLPNPSAKGSGNPSPDPSVNPPGVSSERAENPSAKGPSSLNPQAVDNVGDLTLAQVQSEDTSAGDKGSGNPSGKGSNYPSAKGSGGTPGERGVVTTTVSTDTGNPVKTKSKSNTLVADASTDPYADPDFRAFWDAYPKKVGKRTALRAWKAALRRGAKAADIIAAAQHYRDDPERSRDRGFVKNPEGWLNAERYNDPPPTPEPAASTGSWWDN